jgi:glutamine amidotransferase
VITVIDYGAGNVRSVVKALEAVGAPVTVTSQPADVLAADKVVLPGVGAFGDCMASLRRFGLVDAVEQIVEMGRPFLGICVGMQVLFKEGEEMGLHTGLGVFAGRVVRFPKRLSRDGLKIPHTGWNQILPQQPSPLLDGLPPGAWVYFNHAYYCEAHADCTAALTQHGTSFASVVQRGYVYGLQFHPEKSQQVGLRVLRNFVEAT